MAMRLVLPRQIRSAAGMPTLHDLSESSVIYLDRPRESSEIVGKNDAVSLRHCRDMADAGAQRDCIAYPQEP